MAAHYSPDAAYVGSLRSGRRCHSITCQWAQSHKIDGRLHNCSQLLQPFPHSNHEQLLGGIYIENTADITARWVSFSSDGWLTIWNIPHGMAKMITDQHGVSCQLCRVPCPRFKRLNGRPSPMEILMDLQIFRLLAKWFVNHITKRIT